MQINIIIEQTLSLLFISYMIYYLMRPKPIYVILTVIILVTISIITADFTDKEPFLIILSYLIPGLLVLIFWLYMFRNELFSTRKVTFKRKKFKLYDKVYSTKFHIRIAWLLSAIFLILVPIIYILLNDHPFFLTAIIMTLISLIASIYYLIYWLRSKDDLLVIVIGKSNLTYYKNRNAIEQIIVDPKTIFLNHNFILDPVAQIDFKEEKKRYFIFWIRTDASVDLMDSTLDHFNDFDLSPYIELFDKYEYHHLTIKSLKNLDTIKHERLK